MMILRFAPLGLFVGLCLFGAAGRLDVPAFWAYALGLWLFAGTTYTVLSRRDPEFVAERLRPPTDRDRATRRLVVPLIALHLILAGLDRRFGWTLLGPAAEVVGFVLVFSGLALAAWTIFVNRFASSAVRMQPERAQTVITTGPYALVRHPMYFGTVLFILGSGLALGSLVAGAVIVPAIAIFVRRTRLEDRMLHTELPGYPAYASAVRWRLVPRVY